MAIAGRSITLFCLSTDNEKEGFSTIKNSYSKFPYFDECILGGSRDVIEDNVKILDFSYIKDARGYNEFIIKDLNRFISTDFVLIIQADGYILNPHSWSNLFLYYDYVGAPWYWFGGICGNGGFSLRSKKFLEESPKIFDQYKWDDPKYVPHLYSTCPEDYFLCVKSRSTLESKGIKFAPKGVGQQFSFEYPVGIPNEGLHSSFGFHGKHNIEEAKTIS